jgi:DamX protein
MAREESLATEPGGLFPRLQQRYGLSQDPLALDQPFFGGAERLHGLETLRHLAGFGDMALLVTGERGCGKTRLFAELVRSESDKLSFHRLLPQELTSEQSLAGRLMAIAHKTLGSEQSARDAVFAFFKWSEGPTRKGRRLVLLLDDADHVPASVLRCMLGGHRAADTSYSAVPILSGAEQLLDLISNDDVSEMPLHRIHLLPLSLAEMGDYLTPRVAQAGGDASQLLSRSRLQQLHTLSQGSLGRLKRVAPAVWLDLAGAAPKTRRTGNSFSKRQLLWPMLAVVLLSLSWFVVSWQYDETSGAGVESPVEEAPPVERKIIRLGPGENENGMVSIGPAPSQSRRDAGGEVNRVAEAEEGRDESPAVVDDKAQPEAEPPVPVQSAPESAEPDSPQSDEPRVEVVAPDPANFQPARPGRFVPVSSVQQRPGFTAQYIAGFEEQTATQFLDQFLEVEGLVYTRSTRQGKPWYVVFYGQFRDRAAASRKLQSLGGALGGLAERQPWIRSHAGF